MGFSILFAVCLLSGPAIAQMPAAWKGCVQDADCRIVGGGCFMDAVHHAYVTQGTQYANDINSRVECFRYVDPLLARAVCDFSAAAGCGANENCTQPQGQCRAIE